MSAKDELPWLARSDSRCAAVNLSPDDLRCLWLSLRWGLPLLAAVLIFYQFAINYLHERAEETRAIAKLAKHARTRGLAGATKRMPEGETHAEQSGLPDKCQASAEAGGKAGTNPSQRGSASLPSRHYGRASGKTVGGAREFGQVPACDRRIDFSEEDF